MHQRFRSSFQMVLYSRHRRLSSGDSGSGPDMILLTQNQERPRRPRFRVPKTPQNKSAEATEGGNQRLSKG